jgi:hypothetical protein
MPKRHIPKPLREFNYTLVQERMDGLLINIDRDLQKVGNRAAATNARDHERCFSLLNLMIRFARNSYDAVRYVAGTTPEDSRRRPDFVMVVPPINRQLLDLLFSLVYMLDDFSARSLQYQRAGWRELEEERRMFLGAFSKDAEWKPHFRNLKNVSAELIRYLSISTTEQSNPSLIPYWKTPYQLMQEDTSSRPFLRYLERWLYADTSAQAHLSFAGMAKVGPFLVAEIVGGQDAEWVANRIIKQYHYIHFTRTALVTLAIATEIDCRCALGNLESAAYLWNIFAEYSAEAKEMLEHRYTALLASHRAK